MPGNLEALLILPEHACPSSAFCGCWEGALAGDSPCGCWGLVGWSGG
jgi:hypothetical protein